MRLLWLAFLSFLSLGKAKITYQEQIQKIKCEALPYRSIWIEKQKKERNEKEFIHRRCYFWVDGMFEKKEGDQVCAEAIYNGQLAVLDSWSTLNPLRLPNGYSYHIHPQSMTESQVSADTRSGIICQFELPVVCPDDSMRHGDRCLKLSASATWDKARGECSQGGYGAFVPRDDVDNRMLVNEFGSEAATVWTGTGTSADQWKNFDGTELDFFRWITAEQGMSLSPVPSKGLAVVVAVRWNITQSSGYWMPRNKAEKHRMVCSQSGGGDYWGVGSEECTGGKVVDEETGECRDAKEDDGVSSEEQGGSGESSSEPPTTTTTIETPVITGCDKGFKLINGRCYIVETSPSPEGSSWDEAYDECQKKGLELASVDSARMLKNLTEGTTGTIVVGGFRRGPSFAWSDGSPSTDFTFAVTNRGNPTLNCLMIQNNQLTAYNCNDKIKNYACQVKAASSGGNKPTCQEGWTYSASGNSCYKAMTISHDFLVMTNFTYWHNAELTCATHGGHLASIHSEEENQFMKGLAKNGRLSGWGELAWIGLWKSRDGAEFWSDGSAVKYIDHLVGSREDRRPNQRCGQIMADYLKADAEPAWVPEQFHQRWYQKTGWLPASCLDRSLKFVCKKEVNTVPRKSPVHCPPGWKYDQPSTNCYHVFFSPEQRTNYMDARMQCAVRGAVLTSILNAQEQKTVGDLVKAAGGGDAWIGADVLKVGSFRWDDGNDMVYENWRTNRGTGNCTAMDVNGKWITVGCGNTRNHFVCRKPRHAMLSQTNRPCNTGYTLYGSVCLKIVTSESISFNAAQQKCEKEGAWLAPIGNTDMIEAVKPKNVWVGGVRRGSSFSWMEHGDFDILVPIEGRGNPSNNCLKFNENSGLVATNCNEKAGYICKQYRTDGNNGVPSRCLRGWKFFEKTGHCYKMVETSEDYQAPTETNHEFWHLSELTCQGMGGHLASISDQAENDFVVSIGKRNKASGWGTHAWIGLWTTRDGKHVWTDGSPLNMNNFLDGKPGNPNPNQACHALQTDPLTKDAIPDYVTKQGLNWQKNSWINYNCTIRNERFICEADPPPAAAPVFHARPCRDGFTPDPDSGNCYRVLITVGNYADARLQCAHHGGFVTSIMNEKENNFVMNLVRKSGIDPWIGADNIRTGKLRWDDGNDVKYTNWRDPWPAVPEMCLRMSQAGKWYASPCQNLMGGVVCRAARMVTTYDVGTPCKQGWTRRGNQCYIKFDYNGGVDWESAERRCFSSGAHLATINNVNDLDTLVTKGIFAWVGGYRRGSGFAWTDGTLPTAYAQNIAGRQHSGHNCLLINGKRELLAWDCKIKYPSYTCVAPRADGRGPISPKCPNSWEHFRQNNNCYKRLYTSYDLTGPQGTHSRWFNAELTCSQYGGHLATIASKAEDDFVRNLARNNKPSDYGGHTWIGLGRTRTFANFWVDASPVSYYNVLPNADTVREPFQHCGVMVQDPMPAAKWHKWLADLGWGGKTGWIRENCNIRNRQFVCEVSPSTLNSAPSIPRCPNKWTLDPATGNCFVIVPNKKNYQEAKQNCAIRGGFLASALTPAENAFLFQLMTASKMKEPAWIGVTDEYKDEPMRWDDGNRLQFHMFPNGKVPKAATTICGALNNANNGWTASQCDVIRPFICRFTAYRTWSDYFATAWQRVLGL